jgi:hypothetical protein
MPARGEDPRPPSGAPFAIAHTPAAGVQATVTQAAGGAGVRNVVEAFCAGFSATTALGSITTVTINLRDGASGAGTVLQTWQFSLPATTQPPFTRCHDRLHIIGTANTPTTLEFAAGVTSLVEFVNLSGYTNP